MVLLGRFRRGGEQGLEGVFMERLQRRVKWRVEEGSVGAGSEW